jgi:hypothetical protein
MPTLRDYRSRFKAILIGPSGTGKTGSLVKVINEMDSLGLKRVIVADFDDGLDILVPFVKDHLKDRVFWESFKDRNLEPDIKVGAKIQNGIDAAHARVVRCMSNWPGVGPMNKEGLETLFVIDSLTGLGDADLNYALSFGDEKGSIWRSTGAAMALQERFLQLCHGLSCHLILTSHIRYMGGGGIQVLEVKGQEQYKTMDSEDLGHAHPSALGKKLPPLVAKDFNIMLEYKIEGNLRRISTIPNEQLAVKIPLSLPAILPQDSGLLTVMKAFLNK